jgi:hypothetical protein
MHISLVVYTYTQSISTNYLVHANLSTRLFQFEEYSDDWLDTYER